MFSSCFESTKLTYLMCIKYFCMQCSVFGNDESVAGGGSVAYCETCFGEKMTNKWILKKLTTGMNWTMNCDFPLGVGNNRRQTKFKNLLRLFNANCIWSRLVLPSLMALARKTSFSFP